MRPPSITASARADLSSRVSGLSAAAGSSVRSTTPTTFAPATALTSCSAGKGRKLVTVMQPTFRPSSRSRSTTAVAVSAMVPIETMMYSASSVR